VKIEITIGATTYDLTNYTGRSWVRADSLKFSHVLHEEGKSAFDIFRFTIDWNATIATALFGMSDSNPGTIEVTNNPAVPIFTGYLRPVDMYDVQSTNGVHDGAVTIEAVDVLRSLDDSPETAVAWDDVTVTQAIINTITAAGESARIGTSISGSSLTQNLPVFRIKANDKTYREVLDNLLFQYGYFLYATAGGVYEIYEWALDSDPSPVATVTAGISGWSARKDEQDESRVVVEYWQEIDGSTTLSVIGPIAGPQPVSPGSGTITLPPSGNAVAEFPGSRSPGTHSMEVLPVLSGSVEGWEYGVLSDPEVTVRGFEVDIDDVTYRAQAATVTGLGTHNISVNYWTDILNTILGGVGDADGSISVAVTVGYDVGKSGIEFEIVLPEEDDDLNTVTEYREVVLATAGGITYVGKGPEVTAGSSGRADKFSADCIFTEADAARLAAAWLEMRREGGREFSFVLAQELPIGGYYRVDASILGATPICRVRTRETSGPDENGYQEWNYGFEPVTSLDLTYTDTSPGVRTLPTPAQLAAATVTAASALTRADVARDYADRLAYDELYIGNLTAQAAFINSVQAIDLSADRITTGTLSASRIGAGTITAEKIDTEDLFTQTLTIQSDGSIVAGPVTIDDDGIDAAAIGFVLTSATKQIAGWSFTTSAFSGGDVSIDSDGTITLGTGDNVAILSTETDPYRLWIGDSVPADAPFSVTKAGALYADSGEVGGWSLTDEMFRSAGTGNARIEIDKTLMRISVLDSLDSYKVVQGYLDGLLAFNGTGTATSGNSTTLTDSSKDWKEDKFIGAKITITSGTGAGQTRTITDNNGTVITASFSPAVGTGSVSRRQISN